MAKGSNAMAKAGPAAAAAGQGRDAPKSRPDQQQQERQMQTQQLLQQWLPWLQSRDAGKPTNGQAAQGASSKQQGVSRAAALQASSSTAAAAGEPAKAVFSQAADVIRGMFSGVGRTQRQ
jgi:hypothetical protein